MKNICLAAAAFFLFMHASTVQAQAPGLSWVSSVDGTSTIFGGEIELDGAGNVYTGGHFENSADFDPGAGVNTLTSGGNTDVYIQKLDAAGNYLWAVSFGGVGSDFVNAMEVDAAGNVYVAGMFSATVDFDPGPGVNNIAPAGSFDGYYLKLDASGGLVWVRTTQGVNFESVEDLKLGTNGVYLTGYFTGTVDFDPGAGTNMITSNGSTDAFVQKMDLAGNLLWIKTLGNAGLDRGLKLISDAADNVYVGGGFENTVDLDPGIGIANATSSGGEDGFLLKLNAAGNTVFTRSFGGSAEEFITAITIDASGNIFLGGGFFGTTDLDPGLANYAVTSNGVRDMFISKLDPSGNFLWAAAAGGASYDHIGALSTDGTGNVYATGSFRDLIDFDPGAGVYNMQAIGINYDIYLFKLDASGALLWASQTGSTDADQTYDMETDASLNLYLAGSFQGTVDFDPSPVVYNQTTPFTASMVIKLNQCNTYSATSHTTCGSYVWNNNTYTTSGTYTHVAPNASGCDSIMTLNLTVQSLDSQQTINVCNSYVWNNNTYTASGTYIDTLVSAAGCDSIVTLYLTLHSSSSQQTIMACSSYMWQSNTYTSSGTYIDTLLNAAGCDSVVTLYLTINPAPDTSVTLSNYTLTANAAGVGYQWMDCSTNTPVSGAIGQSYTVTANGSYAVIVTQSGCPDTSSCFNVTITGLNEIADAGPATVFPNPNNGTCTVTAINAGTYFIVNSLGQLVQQFDLPASSSVVISGLDEGIYFLMSSDAKTQAKKIVVSKE